MYIDKLYKELDRLRDNKKCEVLLSIECDGFVSVILQKGSTNVKETYVLAAGFPDHVYKMLCRINSAIEF